MLSFEFGAFGPLRVRVERARLGLPRPLRLLYASDLHLGHWWTARVPQHLLQQGRLQPVDRDPGDREEAVPPAPVAVAAPEGHQQLRDGVASQGDQAADREQREADVHVERISTHAAVRPPIDRSGGRG